MIKEPTTQELFKEIRLNLDWSPSKEQNYSNVNINTLKRLADNWFDKLNYQGDFFSDYNDILGRIDKLRLFKES